MGAAAGAAAAAVIALAVKASGTIVRVEPDEFGRILARQPSLWWSPPREASSPPSISI